jgi:hypothetical protein
MCAAGVFMLGILRAQGQVCYDEARVLDEQSGPFPHAGDVGEVSPIVRPKASNTRFAFDGVQDGFPRLRKIFLQASDQERIGPNSGLIPQDGTLETVGSRVDISVERVIEVDDWPV